MDVRIPHLNDDHRGRSESHFACYSHCYVTWHPLATGNCCLTMPSSRDAVLVTRYLEPFISKCLNAVKVILTQSHESAMTLWNCWIVLRLFLIPMIGGISYKRRQWLIWGMVTHACLRYAREGQNVTQAGPKSHTSRAKMSHKGQNVTQSCYNTYSCPNILLIHAPI